MPLITLKTNVVLDKSKQGKTAAELSALAAELTGKPESFVMAVVDVDKTLLFGGSDQPAAFVQFKSIGLPESRCTEFSERICSVLESGFSIPANRIYIDFVDINRSMFGWNCKTF